MSFVTTFVQYNSQGHFPWLTIFSRSTGFSYPPLFGGPHFFGTTVGTRQVVPTELAPVRFEPFALDMFGAVVRSKKRAEGRDTAPPKSLHLDPAIVAEVAAVRSRWATLNVVDLFILYAMVRAPLSSVFFVLMGCRLCFNLATHGVGQSLAKQPGHPSPLPASLEFQPSSPLPPGKCAPLGIGPHPPPRLAILPPL